MSQTKNIGSSPERIYAFSDGVFAIIITIMAFQLKRPEGPTFDALLKLWATWLSYAVSYVFIAIVWINHHYLLKHVKTAKLRLMWANFAHLFSVSLIPFLTNWVAETRLGQLPVMLYALIFLMVNVTYYWLVWESVHEDRAIQEKGKRHLHFRSMISLSVFFGAMILSYWLPKPGFGLIVFCLLLYVRPEVPAMKVSN